MEDTFNLIEYKNGYSASDETVQCLYCEQQYMVDEIVALDEKLVTARHAIKKHLIDQHEGPLLGLLSQTKEQLGVTQTQKDILVLFAQQLSDTTIAQRLEISTSAVRNQRFKLKEKERQATQFLSVMSLLNNGHDWQVHRGATMIDERYQIHEEERQHVCNTYFDEQGRLKQLPSKEKRKIIVLQQLSQLFDFQKNYSERAVNDLLKMKVDDYVTVRRYLIEYGFFRRTKDGATYWRQG